MKIELLAPAGNAEIGRAAIEAGADAVYIGAERFGARAAAGNSMEEIAALATFAHGFGAQVYLTLNTLLFNDELQEAEALAWRAYEAGIDALIVQDMAFTQLELPPLALHASTQTFNLDPARARQLAEAGFSCLVLERGASLEQIRAIRQTVPSEVTLEAFVHGAICVSYSGQCYLGHVLCGRGGNRGACAQPCRAQYNLENERGEVLARNRPLLSVGDLNLSERLAELIAAGVGSFKIEGRLKEADYVVNNTAHYHQKLEALGVERTSIRSRMEYDFEPNPSKSFSRGFTDYYLDGRQRGVGAGQAKSIGERVGRVGTVDSREGSFILRPASDFVGELNNGDGICFLSNGVLTGTSVNGATNNRITPNRMDGIAVGMDIYRNSDHRFQPHALRTIEATITLDLAAGTLHATDTEGVAAQLDFDATHYPVARNPELAHSNLQQALSKSGGTLFTVTAVNLPPSDTLPFIPAAEANRWRRKLLERLHTARLATYQRPASYRKPATAVPIGGTLDFRANVSNVLAERFYRERGVEIIEWALEAQEEVPAGGKKEREVMRTPYCLRRELGICLKKVPAKKAVEGNGNPPPEELFLENNGTRLHLVFDCDCCEMRVLFTD